MFRRYFAGFTAILSAALFGITTPFNKLLLNSLDPFLLAGLLYLGASAGLFPVILLRKELPFLLKINRANRTRLAGSVILGGIAGPILILFGLRLSSASSVSLWLNLEMVATAVLGFMFFRDYLGRKGWIGVLLALFSGIVLTFNESYAGILPAVLVGSACICWGFDNHFTALIDGISAVQSTFVKGLFAGSVNTFIGISAGHQIINPELIFTTLLVGFFCYGMSIVLYIISAQKIGAIRSQIIFSGAPFFGVLFSVIFISESVSVLQSVSMLLFFISLFFLFSEKHGHYHAHHETEHTHLHTHNDMHHEHDHDQINLYHDHLHKHENTYHSHSHWPDIHHRHGH